MQLMTSEKRWRRVTEWWVWPLASVLKLIVIGSKARSMTLKFQYRSPPLPSPPFALEIEFSENARQDLMNLNCSKQDNLVLLSMKIFQNSVMVHTDDRSTTMFKTFSSLFGFSTEVC